MPGSSSHHRFRARFAWQGLVIFLLLSGCSLFGPQAAPVLSPYRRTPQLPLNLPETLSTRASFPDIQSTSTRLPPAVLATVPLPTSAPPTIAPTPSPAVNETSDLLYTSNGNLMRWDHVTNHVSQLVNNVVEYSASANGKHVVMLRPKKIAANGIEQFELAVLDFETKQLTTLLDQTPRVFEITLSPDGRWVAFTMNKNGGSIQVIGLEPATGYSELGLCIQEVEERCHNFAWSPDSQSLLWTDQRGLWISEPGNNTPRQILSSKIQVADPKGKTSEVSVTFDSLSWSPAGRYALVEILPITSEVRWQGIIDTSTGRWAEVPDSFSLAEPATSAGWMEGGRLIVIHCGDLRQGISPYFKTFQIVPTRSDLLLPGITYSPPFAAASTPSALSGQALTDCPAWITQLDERRIGFSLRPQDTNEKPGLFAFDMHLEELAKITAIPLNTSEVFWSPDGEGAILFTDQAEIFFAPANGMTPEDLRPVLGEDAREFSWLPPAPRV